MSINELINKVKEQSTKVKETIMKEEIRRVVGVVLKYTALIGLPIGGGMLLAYLAPKVAIVLLGILTVAEIALLVSMKSRSERVLDQREAIVNQVNVVMSKAIQGLKEKGVL